MDYLVEIHRLLGIGIEREIQASGVAK